MADKGKTDLKPMKKLYCFRKQVNTWGNLARKTSSPPHYRCCACGETHD